VPHDKNAITSVGSKNAIISVGSITKKTELYGKSN